MASQFAASERQHIILPDRSRRFYITDIAAPVIEDGVLWLPFTSGAAVEVTLLAPLARAKKIHQRVSEFFVEQEPWN